MKKLTGALVLSLSLLLTSACRSAGETRDPEDASTPSNTESPASAAEAAAAVRRVGFHKDDAGSTPSAGQPAAGVDLGGMKSDSGSGSGSGSGTEKPATGGSTTANLSEAERQAQESCLDKWLKGQKLDRYGNAEGTMYAGGTPLFDERTGESRDRLDFVYSNHPEAKKACATSSAPKEAPPKKPTK
jgi:hypothetical protein